MKNCCLRIHLKNTWVENHGCKVSRSQWSPLVDAHNVRCTIPYKNCFPRRYNSYSNWNLELRHIHLYREKTGMIIRLILRINNETRRSSFISYLFLPISNIKNILLIGKKPLLTYWSKLSFFPPIYFLTKKWSDWCIFFPFDFSSFDVSFFEYAQNFFIFSKCQFDWMMLFCLYKTYLRYQFPQNELGILKCVDSFFMMAHLLKHI